MEDQILIEIQKEIRLRMIEESIPRITQCLQVLNEDEIWSRSNTNTNPMGNLVLHLCGNVRQYLISSIGGQPDNRDRDSEFSLASRVSKETLIAELSKLQTEIEHVVSKISTQELLHTRSVQGFQMNGIQIIIHVIEHFSYHTGQIAFFTKQLKDVDLKFYGDLDLNVTG